MSTAAPAEPAIDGRIDCTGARTLSMMPSACERVSEHLSRDGVCVASRTPRGTATTPVTPSRGYSGTKRTTALPLTQRPYQSVSPPP
jgi:hypothetical protein